MNSLDGFLTRDGVKAITQVVSHARPVGVTLEQETEGVDDDFSTARDPDSQLERTATPSGGRRHRRREVLLEHL